MTLVFNEMITVLWDNIIKLLEFLRIINFAQEEAHKNAKNVRMSVGCF